ncbi:MAG: hypothetical protein AAFP22_01030, partial [Planctomycetota bacterium]
MAGALVSGALLLGAAPALAQDGGSDAEGVSLGQEAKRIERNIAALRESISAMIPRYVEDNRPEAARLLERGLEFLDTRDDGVGLVTLEELATRTREDVTDGRILAAFERQTQLVERVATLVQILEDRENVVENAEASLEEVRELIAKLDALSDEEQQIREETEALERDSVTEEARALSEGIEDALNEQRELLRRGEERAQESGRLRAEQLLEGLNQLAAEAGERS